ncbi:MAG: hypothetical protein ACYCSS_04600 [Sulfuriferula sp.]
MSRDNQDLSAGRGRPRLHTDAKAAAAAASRAYRLRKKAERDQRRDPAAPLNSKIIDLSALPVWRRK